ncbi:hypothetical protein L0P50_18710, partial [Lawsonibacter sp. DFI.6.74]|nr:hypothetical protein [Lawsonibacter sp. DFI.6.74]
EVARRKRGSALTSRLSESAEEMLQKAGQYASEFNRSEIDTEHLLLALTYSEFVQIIFNKFKIKVDYLKRQIQAEAKHGEKLHEGEIS